MAPLPLAAGTLRVPGDYPTISAALAAAQASDLVEIACGTYFERDLVLKTGVVVSGATGQPDCVVIDAGGAGRGFVADGVAGCDIVGLTVRNASPAVAGESGGGLRCVGSTVSFSSCTFQGGQVEGGGHGGGVYAENSLLTLDACRFESNVAGGWGGAFHGSSAETHLIDCTFVGNHASRHGAVFLGGAPFAVYETCLFESNTADSSSGGFGAENSVAGLFGCRLLANDGRRSGGAVTVTGSSSVLIQGCTFRNNVTSDEGGAVTVGAGARADIQRSIFDGNCTTGSPDATARGGAIYVGGGSVMLTRTTFLRNSSADVGDHLFLERDVSAATADVTTCIFAFGANGGPVGCGEGATISVACTDVWGNLAGDWVDCLASWADQNGNFADDPLFCDLDEPDLSIRSDSPCAAAQSGCGLVGAIDVGCELFSVQAESWTRVKSRYR
jgi:hypothetical protein